MSSYERYDDTSRHYDRTRVAIGAEIIIGCLARRGHPLASQTLLDAGCGTGAYSQALLPHVGRVVALDMSAGMLAQARAKLAAAENQGRIRFHRGQIDALPFAEASLDAVMINQVLHHLDDDAAAGYPAHRRVLAEVARVLRPGGTLVINSCGQAQIGESYWYYALIPGAAKAMAARFAPLDALDTALDAAGLQPAGRFVPVDAICQGTAYFDGRGPLAKSWRDGDSAWALAGPAELDAALDRVRTLDQADDLDAFVARHDARRAELGQITFIAATRRY